MKLRSVFLSCFQDKGRETSESSNEEQRGPPSIPAGMNKGTKEKKEIHQL